MGQPSTAALRDQQDFVSHESDGSASVSGH